MIKSCRFAILFLSLLFLGMALQLSAQDSLGLVPDTLQTISDTTKAQQIIDDIKNSRVSRQIVKSITKKQTTNPTATIRSEDFFTPYEGRIIRWIYVQRVGFD